MLGTGVPTYQECVPTISERYVIQNWRYPYICLVSVRKQASLHTYRYTSNSELFVTSVQKSKEDLQKFTDKCIVKNQRYQQFRQLTTHKITHACMHMSIYRAVHPIGGQLMMNFTLDQVSTITFILSLVCIVDILDCDILLWLRLLYKSLNCP